MIRLLKYFTAKLWLALILLIILAGIGVGSARLLLPMVDEYRHEARLWAEQALGQPIQIGRLAARWKGINPELVLHDVALLDPRSGQLRLHLNKVHISFGLFDSLRSRTLTIHQITFYGAQLLIKHRADGSVMISGLEALEQGGGKENSLFLLPYQLAMKESEVQWENQAIGATPIHFEKVNITIVNDGDRHQLNAQLQVSGERKGWVELAADIKGELAQPEAWFGDIYFRGEGLALAQLLQAKLPEGYTIEQGQTAMELWSYWERGSLDRLEGWIDGNQLYLNQQETEGRVKPRRLEIEQISGRFLWQRNHNGWRLDADEISFKRNDLSWPVTHLSLLSHHNAEGRLQLRAGIDFLRTDDLHAVVTTFPLLSEEIEEALHGLRPRADLKQLQFRFDETADGPRWSARGGIHQLHLAPWRKLPRVGGLDARFWMDQEQGTMEIAAEGISLEFPSLFRDPLELDKLTGRLHWNRLDGGGWRIESHELSAKNQDIQTRSRLRLELPTDPEQSPFLDLQTDFKEGDAGTLSHYLPVGIMPDAVVRWLDRSIVSGRVLSGSCLVRGPLRDFPFERTPSGRFEVLFDVEDLTLDYWPGWPQAKEISAKVRFLNNRFDTWIEGGRILDSELQPLHGRIDHLKPSTPFLLTGAAHGPLQDEFRLLREFPLAKQFAPLTKALRGEGNAQLHLDLAIPIQKGRLRIDGRMTFLDSMLHLKGYPLSLTHIQGDLRFTRNGVTAKGLRTQLLEQPITMDLATSSEQLEITARGNIPSKWLAEHFPNMGLEQLQGSSDWTLALDLPPLAAIGKATIKLKASSDLIGTTIALSAPLGKSSEERRPFHLTTELSEQPLLPLTLRYGNLLDAALLLDRSDPKEIRLERGELRLGGAAAQIPEEKGLQIQGQIDTLNLDPWIAGKESAGAMALPDIRTLNLQIGQLQAGGVELKDVAIDLLLGKDKWNAHLKSSRFKGLAYAAIPLGEGPIHVRLAHATLDFDSADLSNEPPARHPDSAMIDPRTLPGLDLTSDRTTINGKPFGRLELQAQHTPVGLNLTRFSLNSGQQSLSASGEWIFHNNSTQTTLDFNLETPSMGHLLEALDFAPNLKEAPAKIEGSLRWSGGPRQISQANLNGTLDMRIKEGRFLDVDPGIGRVFGLLNISALQRRLSLDFSDLYKKGFSFDQIDGTFTLDEGDAYTNNFRIKGIVAQIDISGRTGLVDQDFDQLVTVTPKLSSSFPLAGTIAAGPAIGVALFVAQKILGKTVDKIARSQYTIAGSWENPVIAQNPYSHEEGSPPSTGGTPSATPTPDRSTPPWQKTETIQPWTPSPKVRDKNNTESTGQQKEKGLIQHLFQKLKSMVVEPDKKDEE